MVDLPVTNYHQSVNDNPVYNDLKIIENLEAAVSYLKYHKKGTAQKLLHALKYNGCYQVGVLLGRLFSSHLAQKIHGDLMIPVPIHKSKIKKRGYNQSAAICEGLQHALMIPFDDQAVIRQKASDTQTKKQKVDRWLSMEGLFHVKNPSLIESRKIIIVDDVITTGATIYSLCAAINKYNPASITVIALASGK